MYEIVKEVQYIYMWESVTKNVWQSMRQNKKICVFAQKMNKRLNKSDEGIQWERDGWKEEKQIVRKR